MAYVTHDASFRDPDTLVLKSDTGIVYRQLNESYRPHYTHLMQSGLYESLVNSGRLLPHEEVENNGAGFKTIRPAQLSFVSYPWEWCFDQYRDAALLTLDILKASLDHGMILKDATPYNVQLHGGRPVFIDTGSFELYTEGTPWVAYRQFCESFLGPLLLMHYAHSDMGRMLQVYPRGIPLQVVSSLLPLRSRFKMGVLLHIHFQAGYKAGKAASSKIAVMPKQRLYALGDHLRTLVAGLKPAGKETVWEQYYEETILSETYLANKTEIVSALLADVNAHTALDLGANTGLFSEMLAKMGLTTIAADSDHGCINRLYAHVQKNKVANLYPVVSDFTNPGPGLGWANTEHAAFTTRAKSDLCLALALLHHVVIASGIPLHKVAEGLSSLCRSLIIEFVPKDDPKAQLLLQHRKDVFADYSIENFEETFAQHFKIVSRNPAAASSRVIYLMEKK